MFFNCASWVDILAINVGSATTGAPLLSINPPFIICSIRLKIVSTAVLCNTGSLDCLTPIEVTGEFNSIACFESSTITSDLDFNITRSAVAINCEFEKLEFDTDCRIRLFNLKFGNICVLFNYMDELSSLIFSTAY